jgi:uroporphyrinogen decarboxylase
VTRWLGEGLPEDFAGRPEGEFGKLLFMQEYFSAGEDVWRPVGVNTWMSPLFKEKTISQDEEYRTFRDMLGVIKREKRRHPESSMPEFLEYPVKERKDFLRLKKRYDPHDPKRYPDDFEHRVEKWRTRDYPLGLGLWGYFWTLRDWMGPEGLMCAMIDDPDWIKEMMEFLTDFFVETLDRLFDAVRVDWVSVSEDMAYKTGSFISPEMFRRFMSPCYRRLTHFLRSHGSDVIVVDSDGNIEELIPLWLDAGLSGVSPLEVQAGMDAADLRRRYGKSLILFGGIDKRVLARDRAAIDRELAKLPPVMEQGGYIPALDHAVPSDVSFQNYLYFVEQKRKLICGG